jgi:hypothetical protein
LDIILKITIGGNVKIIQKECGFLAVFSQKGMVI